MTTWKEQNNRWTWSNTHVEILLYETQRPIPEPHGKTYITRINNKDLNTEKVSEIYAKNIGTAKILAVKYAYSDMLTVRDAMQEGMLAMDNYLRVVEKNGEN